MTDGNNELMCIYAGKCFPEFIQNIAIRWKGWNPTWTLGYEII